MLANQAKQLRRGDRAYRDYRELLTATSQLLSVLSQDGPHEEALRNSFEALARGFAAQKALLLLAEKETPLRLRAIHSLGALSPEQLRACEQGESTRGVSPSVIRQVLAEGRPVLVEDPRLHAEAARTPSLSASAYSVVCAPIPDLARGGTLAVLYLQSSSLIDAYDAGDLAWLEGWTAAAGQVFGYFFRKQLETRHLERQLAARQAEQDAPEILGSSQLTQSLIRSLHEVFIPALAVEHPEPILILGERGTGKDLVARYLHAYSARGARPLVVASCAEITDDLAASRFFGHKRGSFTGALSDEPGYFRAAHGGVLFLDEIGELSPRAQAHLLRVLENHTVSPVGQTREQKVDVAVVLATNRDLDQAVAEGLLRADFHDRFRTLAVTLPPLRDRPADVPLLLDHFRRENERKHRKPTLGFSPEALRALSGYAWPGNVRELARACALFVIHAQPGTHVDRGLLERCLPEVLHGPRNPKAATLLGEGLTLDEATAAFQRELIAGRLERCGGNVKAARESLGMSKTTFHRYTKNLGIPAADSASED